MGLSHFSNIAICIFAGFSVCEGLSFIHPMAHFHPALSPPAEYVCHVKTHDLSKNAKEVK